MRSKRLIVLSAVAVALAACMDSGAQTNANDTPIAVHEFTDMSCGAWVASSSNPVGRAQYIAWVVGFTSGVNFGNPHHQVGIGTSLGSETVTLYVNKYCGDHPLGNVVGAAMSLVRDLGAPNAKHQGGTL